MRFLCQTGGVLAFAMAASLAHADVVGQEAHYKLDRSLKRTSSLILSGKFHAKVKGLSEEGSHYLVNYSYDLDILMRGRMRESGEIKVPQEFLSPEFRDKLRQEGTIKHELFTLTHKGRVAKVKIPGQPLFRDCDRVRIDKIKGTVVSEFNGVVDPASLGNLKNIVINLQVCSGIPVVGGATIDIKGKLRRFPFKMGFDYKPQT